MSRLSVEEIRERDARLAVVHELSHQLVAAEFGVSGFVHFFARPDAEEWDRTVGGGFSFDRAKLCMLDDEQQHAVGLAGVVGEHMFEMLLDGYVFDDNDWWDVVDGIESEEITPSPSDAELGYSERGVELAYRVLVERWAKVERQVDGYVRQVLVDFARNERQEVTA